MRLVPRDWPIAWRITAGMLIAAVAPLVVTTWLASQRGKELVQQEAYRRLRVVARVTAARIDQFLGDYQVSLRAMSSSPLLLRVVEGDRDGRDDLEEMAAVLVKSDDAVATLFFTDLEGHVFLATNPRTQGRDVSFRRYWQVAREGREYISTLLVGRHTGEPGIYIAAPVRRGDGPVLAVAVMKIGAATIDGYVRQVSEEQTGAALIDSHGVILSGRDPSLRFHTIRPLTDEQVRAIDPERLWGRSTLPPVPFAAAQVVERSVEGDAWRTEIEGETYYAGEATLHAVPWSILAYEPKSQIDEPIRRLFRQQIGTIVLVALFVLLFVFSHARSILRPVRRLSGAAERLAAGDLDARAEVRADDELGRLARAFNRMVPELEAGVAMRNSLALAHEVQRNLLPAAPPDFGGLDLAGHSRPADETGGDYFDFLDLRPFGDERLGVVVGDVVGHGVAAALLMASARANLRAHARPLGDLGALFRDVNRLVAEDVRQGQFMSLLFLVVDPAARTARWMNAGHHPPFHWRASEDAVHELTTRNVPLGILPEWAFEPSPVVALGTGDVLLLGTDGIWEAVNPRGEAYGTERVARLLREHARTSADEILQALLADLERFREGVPFADDVTIVAVRVTDGGA